MMVDNEVVELNAKSFGSIIRMVMRAQASDVACIRAMTYGALQRLKVPRDISKAFVKMPNGSDQFDSGSLKAWLLKIKPTDEVAIKQLVQIDATAVSRS